MKTNFSIMEYMVENFLDKRISINNEKPFFLKRIGISTMLGEALIFQDEDGKKHEISYSDIINVVE